MPHRWSLQSNCKRVCHNTHDLSAMGPLATATSVEDQAAAATEDFRAPELAAMHGTTWN